MIINFAYAYRLQKPDMGNVGGCRHFEIHCKKQKSR